MYAPVSEALRRRKFGNLALFCRGLLAVIAFSALSACVERVIRPDGSTDATVDKTRPLPIPTIVNALSELCGPMTSEPGAIAQLVSANCRFAGRYGLHPPFVRLITPYQTLSEYGDWVLRYDEGVLTLRPLACQTADLSVLVVDRRLSFMLSVRSLPANPKCPPSDDERLPAYTQTRALLPKIAATLIDALASPK